MSAAAREKIEFVAMLSQNVPNPFTKSTNIKYTVPGSKSAYITLKIYDSGGRLIRTLVDGEEKSGPHTITWDGKDNEGKIVSSGHYFCRFKFAPFAYGTGFDNKLTQKLIYLGGKR